MKINQNPVTDADADKFQAYMEFWQERLGLLDWRIVRSPKRCANMAEVYKRDAEARLACYRVGSHFGAEQVNDYTLESTAVHEMLHILLTELIDLARSGADAKQVMAAEHRVVHTFERLLVPKV